MNCPENPNEPVLRAVENYEAMSALLAAWALIHHRAHVDCYRAGKALREDCQVVEIELMEISIRLKPVTG